MGDVKRMVGAFGLRSKENEVMSQLIMPRHVLNPEKGLNYSYLLKECLDPKQDWIK